MRLPHSLPVLFLFVIFATGCASIDYSDYRQAVLVTTDPPGAQVYDQGEWIGTTPGYMRVRRRKNPRVEFRWASDTHPEIQARSREVKLNTRYRWADSLAMNALFITYAPVGWAIDWMTGTAWNLQDPPVQNFSKVSQWPVARPPRIVAVAPPEGVDVEVADALGMAVDEKLRSSEKFSVLDYQETSPIFQFYRSYSGLAEDQENRYRLFSELQADHVLQTKAQKQGEKFIVTGELRDTVTTRLNSTYAWEITPGTEKLKSEFTAQTFINQYFHLIPNTVFLNLSNYIPNLSINQQDYRGKEAEAHGWGDEIAKYLSAISIARLEREQFNTRGHWVFSFVPTVVVSQKHIIFPDYTPDKDAQYRRLYVSGGYGVEGGYMGRFGLVYGDIIPTLTWSKIRYQSELDDGEVSRLSVQAMVEIGYSYFFTDHLIGRIYFRNLGEDNKLWNEALTRTSGQTTFTDSVSSGFAGFSIGYYIPTTIKRQDGWLIRKTR